MGWTADMPVHGSVLILKTGGDDPLELIFEKLADEPSITLAWPRALDVEKGVEFLKDRPAFPGFNREPVAVVLLIGRESDTPRAVELIRRVRPYVHIVALSIETGTAQLSIRDPDYSELARVINSLIDDETPGSRAEFGKVLKFRARLPVADEAGAPDDLPMVAEAAADPENLKLLDAGLAWADTATRALMTIWAGAGDEEAPGFALSWEALERWLARIVGIADAPALPAQQAYLRFQARLADPAAAKTPLARVAQLVGGDELSLKLVLIVLAGELDIRFHRMFGTLHDDLGRRQPSAGLACAIIAAATPSATPTQIRVEIAALDGLRGLGLIEDVDGVIGGADEPLRIDPRLLDWLLTGRASRLSRVGDASLMRRTPKEALALLPQSRRDEVWAAERHAVAGHGDASTIAAVVLTGSQRGWIESEAAALAGPELRIGPPASDLAAPALRKALRTAVVAARLTGRRLVVDLLAGGASAQTLWVALEPMLDCEGSPAFVLTDDPAQLLALTPSPDIVVASLPQPAAGHRTEAIRLALLACGEEGDPGEALAERIANQFPLALDRIPDAVALALSTAAAERRPVAPEPEDWLAGFRAVAGARLPRLARRVPPQPCPEPVEFSCLDRVILPEQQKQQLQAIIKHVRLGHVVLEEWGFGELLDAKGVAALFTGDSGTGKTLAAHAIASELATDLYAVDLSQVVSKYIGETEKNLGQVFDEAEASGAVLLFDEADALFGKRSTVTSAHDRYANIEVSYLLQRMQQFRGLALLTSNLPDNMDAAFARRLRFTVEFPRPNAQDRLRIWEQSLPVARRTVGLDLQPIAQALAVPGGVIRQMALHAAMQAAYEGTAVGRSQLVAGATAELVRLGNYADLPRLTSLYPDASRARAA